jgi:hypothetical protein
MKLPAITLCVIALLCAATTHASEAISDKQSVVGVYKFTTPPGFPYPGTDTITLSSDGHFRYDMSLSGGKMAAFIGTWSYSDGIVTAVTNERFVEGKPYPSTGEGWKPGNLMTLYIKGDELRKNKTTDEKFMKVRE